MKKSQGSQGGLSLVEVLVIIVIIGILAALLLPALSCRSPHSRSKRDCTNNLKQLGTYIALYKDRYGQRPPPGCPRYLDTLRTAGGTAAVAYGQDAIFVCKVLGTKPSPTAHDYRCANYVCTDEIYPTQPQAADRITNHSPNGDDDINVLLYDGSVQSGAPGNQHWLWANAWTTG